MEICHKLVNNKVMKSVHHQKVMWVYSSGCSSYSVLRFHLSTTQLLQYCVGKHIFVRLATSSNKIISICPSISKKKKKLNILSIDDMNTLQCCCISIYKCIYSPRLLANSFNEFSPVYAQVQSHDTRQAVELRIPLCRMTQSQFSFT